MSDEILFDLESLGQNPEDPIWPSEPLDPAVEHGKHQAEAVRTLSGMLDLMHHVVEEAEEWIERETEHGAGHRMPKHRDRPIILRVTDEVSESWRGATFDVGKATLPSGAGMQIAQRREDRKRVIVTNWGPGILYLSHETNSGQAEPQPGQIQIAPPGPDATKTGQLNFRVFLTRGAIWAYPATAGTSQLCDVQEEYGEPES